MARSFPPDVVVFDRNSLLHVRLERGTRVPRIEHAKLHRLADDLFAPGVVSPSISRTEGLVEVLRRVKLEAGRLERVSVLLPDSWFRINLVELPSLPDRQNEADEMVRWSLKKSLPVRPEELRLRYLVLERSSAGAKILVISALEKLLESIESAFAAAGISVVLIESVGLNIWNALTAREAPTTLDRLFLYVREHDFTTALFRGPHPVFIRSRNLAGERMIAQEIKLSASYLRDNLQPATLERCYVAGNGVDASVVDVIATEFHTPVATLELRDFAETNPSIPLGAMDAELAACTGVFTA